MDETLDRAHATNPTGTMSLGSMLLGSVLSHVIPWSPCHRIASSSLCLVGCEPAAAAGQGCGQLRLQSCRVRSLAPCHCDPKQPINQNLLLLLLLLRLLLLLLLMLLLLLLLAAPHAYCCAAACYCCCCCCCGMETARRARRTEEVCSHRASGHRGTKETGPTPVSPAQMPSLWLRDGPLRTEETAHPLSTQNL